MMRIRDASGSEDRLDLTLGKTCATLPLQEETANAKRLSLEESKCPGSGIPYRASHELVDSDLLNRWFACLERSFVKDPRSMMILTRVHLAYGDLVHVEYDDEDEGPEKWPVGGSD